jgi:pimeloyl-ACP methyl ester carboxylesterase
MPPAPGDADRAVTRAAPLRTVVVGDGRPLLLLHGFGMEPHTYLPLARLLAPRLQVVIPAIFALPGRWTYEHALACIEATLDDLQLDRVSLLSHSFGGGLGIGLASRRPERVVECVFGDTLGVRERFGLAEEATRHPFGILAMAKPNATTSFIQSVLTHPMQLASAALWGFSSDRDPEIDDVAAAGIPCHVLWANHDTLLARSDGRDFAHRLHADFTVARPPRVEHDWMFDAPEHFAAALDRLGLVALTPVG